MCGICGVYSLQANPSQEGMIFRNLLYINQLRGQDSTGVVKITKRAVDYRKSILSSDSWLKAPANLKFIHDTGAIGFIGHCRSATVGIVSSDNAHPFKFDHVLGVMNGTIKKSYKHEKDYQTDSEAIFRTLNDEGLEETLKDIASRTSGYALVWIDNQKNTLNFIRNKDRPLAMTYIYGRSTIVWSSDVDHLKLVLKHHKIEPIGWDPKNPTKDPFFEPPPHKLVSIEIGKPASSASVLEIPVDPAPIPPTFSTFGDDDAWSKFYGHHGYPKSTSKSSTPPASEVEWVKGPNGVFEPSKRYASSHIGSSQQRAAKILKHASKANGKGKQIKYDTSPPGTYEELVYKLKEGCCNCGQETDPKNVEACAAIQWYNREHYCCPNCIQSDMWQYIVGQDV